jgi:hypothetical protein
MWNLFDARPDAVHRGGRYMSWPEAAEEMELAWPAVNEQ